MYRVSLNVGHDQAENPWCLTDKDGQREFFADISIEAPSWTTHELDMANFKVRGWIMTDGTLIRDGKRARIVTGG